MYSVGVSEAAVGSHGGTAVGELDFVEFIVAVLNLTGAVGDKHRGEGFVKEIIIVIRAVDNAHVARGEKLRKPSGGVERKVVGLKVEGLLNGLVVKAERVGADGLGAFHFGFCGGVAGEFGQFGAVEHIGEPEPEVGGGVGEVDGKGATAYVDGYAEDFIRRGVVVFGGLPVECGTAYGEHGEAVFVAVAGITVGREYDADKAGVASASDDVVCNQFLVFIFERRHDVKKRHGNIGRGGDDAARGEELPRYDGSGLQVGVAVAVEDRESTGGGSGVGGSCR